MIVVRNFFRVYVFSLSFWVVLAPTYAQQNDNVSDPVAEINALYEEIFNDPSNVETNIKLVRAQISVGDFKGASGTLERLLILAPKNRTAQFLMARVKAANENYQEAKFLLLEVIDADDTKDTLKESSRSLLEEIDSLADGFSWQATVGINAGISRNPDAKPDNPSYSLLAPTVPIDVKGGTEEYAGLSLSGVVEMRLNTYEKRVLRANLSHQRRDFLTYDKADFETYGGQFQLLNDDRSPFLGALVLNRVRVRDFDFMDQVGLNAMQSFNLSPRYRVDVTGDLVRHVHRESPHFADNEEKTGYQGKANLGMNAALFGMRVRTGIGYERKLANRSKHSYHIGKLTGSTSLPIGPLNMGVNLALQQKRFDQGDNVFSLNRRRETTATLGFNSTLPIRDIVPRWDDNLNITLSGSISKTQSNVKKFNTTRGEVTLNFVYSFGDQ